MIATRHGNAQRRAAVISGHFVLASLGSLFADFSSDDAGAVTGVDGADTRYVSIPNQGSGGGALNGDLAGAFPFNRPLQRTAFFGGRNSAQFEFDRRLFSTLANADWTFLHDASDATLFMRVAQNALNASTGLYLSNMTGVAGNVGMHLKVTPAGALRYEVGNGTDIQAATSADGVITAADARFTLCAFKATVASVTTITLEVNGTQVATATPTTPSAAAPTNALCYGGYIASTSNSSGANVGQGAFYKRLLSPAERSRVNTLLATRWP